MSIPDPARMSSGGLTWLIFIVASLTHLFWTGVGLALAAVATALMSAFT
jgi:hypothetical protein